MFAVARKVRAGELPQSESASLRRRIDRDYQRVLKVRLTQEVLRDAERLLFEFALGVSDAVHSGSAAVGRLAIRSLLSAAHWRFV
jgi:hypothetical protein